MDALIVSIQMILVRRIIHPTKPYMYSLSLENEPASSNSHLTRNEKWKLWIGWQGSSCWLLCLCVLCFVFCAASKTIWCSRVSPYYLIFQKIKIMSYVFWRVTSLRPEKKRSSRLSGGCAIIITTGKKKVLVICLAGARSLLQPEKKKYSRLSGGCAIFITNGKKKL